MIHIGHCLFCDFFLIQKSRRDAYNALQAHFRIFKRRKHPEFNENLTEIYRVAADYEDFKKMKSKKFYKGLRGNLPAL